MKNSILFNIAFIVFLATTSLKSTSQIRLTIKDVVEQAQEFVRSDFMRMD